MDEPARVIGCGDAGPGWPWVTQLAGAPDADWRFHSTAAPAWARRIPGLHVGRLRAALAVRRDLRSWQPELLISFGPWTSDYVERIAGRSKRGVPHLAMTFNFTDIPEGVRLNAMRRSFAGIERFAVFSQMERALYAERFDIPIDRFHFLRWGVAPPIAAPLAREIAAPYFAALGGEARDYATLCAAARRLPALKFVLIARPHSLAGISVPDNVTVHVNLPFDRAWSLVWHAAASLVPLRTAKTPNGHVTVVGGMHLGKAQVVTDSAGVRDYVADRETALLAPANDPAAFARAIEELADDPALAARLGTAAQAFARDHCSEDVTVAFFREQLASLAR